MQPRPLEQMLDAVTRQRAKYGLPVEAGCPEEQISKLRYIAREHLGSLPPERYFDLLRIVDGFEENGLVVFSSGMASIEGFVKANQRMRLDRAGYDQLLVFAYSGMYVHVMYVQSGKYGLLPHENDPAEPSRVFDTFEELLVDAVRGVIKPGSIKGVRTPYLTTPGPLEQSRGVE